MRIVAEKTLRAFWAEHESAEEQLRIWIQDVRRSVWKSPHDVKAQFASSSILGNNRVCFNIKGNDYRLIVSINYASGVLFIKWLGTHSAYDDVDANTVEAN